MYKNPIDVFTSVFRLNCTNCLYPRKGPLYLKYFLLTNGSGSSLRRPPCFVVSTVVKTVQTKHLLSSVWELKATTSSLSRYRHDSVMRVSFWVKFEYRGLTDIWMTPQELYGENFKNKIFSFLTLKNWSPVTSIVLNLAATLFTPESVLWTQTLPPPPPSA